MYYSLTESWIRACEIGDLERRNDRRRALSLR